MNFLKEMGDRGRSFEREAWPHQRAIHRTASRVLRSISAADEVTQEVFLTAWKSFDRFAPGTNCRAWLFQILTFTMQHYQRHERRFPAIPEGHADTMEAPTPVGRHLTDRRLRSAVQRLPPHYRHVLVLVDLEEFSYRETATVLRVPVGTVMSRLSRARRQMRQAQNLA
ncbi:MAG: sigma-70 family RNA polymerase sigma factor [Bryobacteraceae bacterium]|nr:sigma-70 family RNA polymerase sigma factor [Bryobacteraceae bacterium]